MPETRSIWSNRAFEALFGAAYNYGVEHPWLARPAARALFGSDVEQLYSSMDVVCSAPAGSAILDVPCGGGVTLSRLTAPLLVRYVAADISVTMLDRARRRASEQRLNGVEFVEADITRLPFTDCEFDLCVCFNGLHCLPDPEAAVRELARVLKPGGRLVGDCVVFGARRRADAYVKLLGSAKIFGPTGSKAELKGWLVDAGLRIDRLERSGAIAHFEATRPEAATWRMEQSSRHQLKTSQPKNTSASP